MWKDARPGAGSGVIRYIKGDKCGVYLDRSQTTHYYHWGELVVEGAAQATVEAAPELTTADIRNAFEALFTDDYREADLDALRQFYVTKSHNLGLLTPWDSDTAMVGWYAEDFVNNGTEIADGLTLERVEAAQHVLAEARRWLEK